MSISIYCQAYLNGIPQEIDVSLIINQFLPNVVKSNEFGFEIKYDEMNSSFVYIDINKKTCSGFSISRPCGDKRLFKSIFKCLKLGNFISFDSEGNEFYITNKLIVNHLPIDLKEIIEDTEAYTIIINNAEEYLRSLGY